MIFSDGTTADLKEYFIEKNPKKMVSIIVYSDVYTTVLLGH